MDSESTTLLTATLGTVSTSQAAYAGNTMDEGHLIWAIICLGCLDMGLVTLIITILWNWKRLPQLDADRSSMLLGLSRSPAYSGSARYLTLPRSAAHAANTASSRKRKSAEVEAHASTLDRSHSENRSFVRQRTSPAPPDPTSTPPDWAMNISSSLEPSEEPCRPWHHRFSLPLPPVDDRGTQQHTGQALRIRKSTGSLDFSGHASPDKSWRNSLPLPKPNTAQAQGWSAPSSPPDYSKPSTCVESEYVDPGTFPTNTSSKQEALLVRKPSRSSARSSFANLASVAETENDYLVLQ
eukprot:scpid85217/ scgid28290/ 